MYLFLNDIKVANFGLIFSENRIVYAIVNYPIEAMLFLLFFSFFFCLLEMSNLFVLCCQIDNTLFDLIDMLNKLLNYALLLSRGQTLPRIVYIAGA